MQSSSTQSEQNSTKQDDAQTVERIDVVSDPHITVPNDAKVTTSANEEQKTLQENSPADTLRTNANANSVNSEDNASHEDDASNKFWDEYNRLLDSIQATQQQEAQSDDQESQYEDKPTPEAGTFCSKFTHGHHTYTASVQHDNVQSSLEHDASSNHENATVSTTQQNSGETGKSLPSHTIDQNDSIKNPSFRHINSHLDGIFLAHKKLWIAITAIGAVITALHYFDLPNNLLDSILHKIPTIKTLPLLSAPSRMEINTTLGDHVLVDTRYMSRVALYEAEQQKNHITDVQAVMSQLIHPKEHVINVGCGFGFDAFYMRHLVTDEGAVYCFEGQNEIFYLLKESAQLNGAYSMKLYNNCVYSTSAQAFLKVDPNAGLERRYDVIMDEYEAKKHQNITKVKAIRLDDVIHDMNSVALLYINAPGNEVDILRGATKIISSSDGIKIITSWTVDAENIQQYKSAIHALSYMRFKFWIIGTRGKLVGVDDPNTLLTQNNIYILITKSI